MYVKRCIVLFKYDTKMLKLQKENARKQQVPQSSNANQDIFRKVRCSEEILNHTHITATDFLVSPCSNSWN